MTEKCRDYSSDVWASLMAQMVKNLPAMQDTWVQSLGREDPLEKRMATHFINHLQKTYAI